MINVSFATERQKKLKPAPNYQFMMVHGVSSWDVEWYKDGVVDCLEEMGIPTFNIHAYSQNFPEQSAFINAREFGDRSYTGPRRKFGSNTNDQDTPKCSSKYDTRNKSWIDMAQEDFKNSYELNTAIALDGIYYSKSNPINISNIPTQNFILTHSYGNMAVRGYLCSGQFPERAPNSLEIVDFVGSGLQNNQWQIEPNDYQDRFVKNSFYQDDVTKVIFLAPPFTGSDMAALASIKAIAFLFVQSGQQIGLGPYLMPIFGDLVGAITEGNVQKAYGSFGRMLKIISDHKDELKNIDMNKLLTDPVGSLNSVDDFVEPLAPVLRQNSKDFIKAEAILRMVNMIKDSNMLRILPYQYYMMANKYAFSRIYYALLQENGGWNRPMFSTFTYPGWDEILSVVNPAFGDILPLGSTVWKYANADMNTQYDRPIIKVGYGIGSPLNSVESIVEVGLARAGGGFGLGALKSAKIFNGFGVNKEEEKEIEDSAYIMGSLKWSGLSTETEKAMSLWSKSFLSLDMSKNTIMNKIGNDLNIPVSAPLENGDGAVPEWSFKGKYNYGNRLGGIVDYSDDATIPFLKDATFHPYLFKPERFESFIKDDFPMQVAAADAAYLLMVYNPFCPISPDIAKWIQLAPAISLINNIDENANSISEVVLAHPAIRKKHEFIENLMYEKPELTCLENDVRIATNNVAWSGLFLESISKNSDIDFPGNVIADYTDASKHHADVLRVYVPSGSTNITKYYERMATVNPDFVKDENEETAEDILFKFDNFTRPVALRTFATKAQSMIMRNVVYELLPEKMKELSYSYNFAAWKSLLPVGANGGSPNQVDRWGRTQTGVLDLAEGQNILTFKLANKVGMSNNQFLRIIKSSTPMLPGSDTDIV